MSQVRGVVSLFVVSYLIQAMLLVNSAETELYNSQKQVGQLLATQLANSAAPLLISKDSVGLGLLANRFGETEAILSLRVLNSRQEVVATGGSAQSQQGRVYHTPVVLEKAELGSAEVVLASPVRGDIIRGSALNLLVSLALHVFMALWIGWPQLFRNIRIPILQPLPEDKPVVPEPVAEPLVLEPEPEPVKAAASVLVHFSFDDRKNLMQKVNASTAEQFLMIADKLLKRATRLYTGKQQASLIADGVTVRFDGDTIADCMNRAVLCSRLFAKLADTAYQKRRQAKQFALRIKAAVIELNETNEAEAGNQLKRLTGLTNVNQILVQADDALITDLQGKHQLKAFEAGEEDSKNADIKAHFVESLAPEIEEELSTLEKRILERKKPTEEAGQ